MDDIAELLRNGHQARREHRLDDARRLFTEVIDLGKKLSLAEFVAEGLTGLGQIERDLNHLDKALEAYSEARVIYRGGNHTLTLAHTIRHLGDIHTEHGDLAAAEPCFVEALSIYRNHPETKPLDLANALRGYAVLKQNTGQKAESKLLWEEARELYCALNIETGVSESSRRIAALTDR